ncbi:precorrin-6A reductase [Robertmurraya korlensis]|uniref:precorrin-6A reductase n=1 Tax=Robertmurraya korlensis TaxID=519977 RepID=UPI000A043C72|nr:precorrin-6A reductase [Robertmurraya korlensis]
MIFLLAGTSDGKELAKRIHANGFPLVVSVVTQNAAMSLKAEGIPVLVNRLTAVDMEKCLADFSIQLVIDASHPYAEEASRNMIQATTSIRIPYIRYERKSPVLKGKQIAYVGSYEKAAELASKYEGNIMLTTGAKTMGIFSEKLRNRRNGRTLFRLLPLQENLEKCERLGIASRDIIAIQGPFSKGLNKALFLNYEIRLLVTKESGNEGSFHEKVEAAEELGIETIIIKRPCIHFGTTYDSIESIIQFIKGDREYELSHRVSTNNDSAAGN